MGTDDIAYALTHRDAIAAFEQACAATLPWL